MEAFIEVQAEKNHENAMAQIKIRMKMSRKSFDSVYLVSGAMINLIRLALPTNILTGLKRLLQ